VDPRFADFDFGIEEQASWTWLFVRENCAVGTDVEFSIAGQMWIAVQAGLVMGAVENGGIDLLSRRDILKWLLRRRLVGVGHLARRLENGGRRIRFDG
jgi:hypothetical protein